MKKALALALALLMCTFLFAACSATTDSTGTSSSSSSSSSESSDDASGDSSASAEEPSAASSSGSSSPGDGEFPALEGKKLAYFAITMSNIWLQNMQEYFDGAADAGGFEVLNADADFSAETQLSQIDTLINDGLDGAVVFVADEGSGQAVVDKFEAAGIPVIGESLRLQDADGNPVAPLVELDAAGVGANCAKWMAEHYKDYDLDWSDMNSVGVILDTRSTYQSDVMRSDGFQEALLKALPEIPEANYYTADCAAEANASDDAEASYSQVTSVLTAHPEIKAWILFGSVDDYALGASRAVEAAGMEDKVIITSCGGERAIIEWENSDSPCWVSTCYYDAGDFGVKTLSGLNEMIGGTPADELWPEYIEPGQKYAVYRISGTMATPDTIAEIMSSDG